jgi:hypothetical protein
MRAFSTAVELGIKWKDWEHEADIAQPVGGAFAFGHAAMSRSSNRTLPPSGASSPAASMSSVVLPEPLGPQRATNSPGSIFSETPSMAHTVSPSLG